MADNMTLQSAMAVRETGSVMRVYDKVGFIIVLIVIALFAVVGNTLVLAVAFRSEKMRTANNYFIFNLAICDFIVGAFSIPVMVSSMVAERWLLGGAACYMSAFVDNLVMIQSTWTLSSLSAFRALNLCNPLMFKQSSMGRYCVWLLVVQWLLAGLFVATPCFGWSKYAYSSWTYNCGSVPGEGIHRYFFLVFIMLVLFCPLSIVVTSYIIILYTALSEFTKSKKFDANYNKSNPRNDAKKYKSVQQPGSPVSSLATSTIISSSALPITCIPNRPTRPANMTKKSSSSRFAISQNRSVKSSLRVMLIVGLFLVCVGPLLIIAFLMWLGNDIPISPVLALIVYVMSLSNSAINPCIYGLFDVRFRKAYKDLFTRPRYKQNHCIPANSDYNHGTPPCNKSRTLPLDKRYLAHSNSLNVYRSENYFNNSHHPTNSLTRTHTANDSLTSAANRLAVNSKQISVHRSNTFSAVIRAHTVQTM